MPLTPADVHNVAFRKPPINKRGYDEEEVDAFLDEVERELLRLTEENNTLRAQIERGGGGGGGGAGLGPSVSHEELAEVRAQLDRALHEKGDVEQTARYLQSELEQAQAQASSGSNMDHSELARVLMMAQRTADDHMADARREAEQLLADARLQADDAVSRAQAAALAVEGDARQRHEEIVGGLDAKRSALLARLDEWTRFARDYREMLKVHLDQQLGELRSAEMPVFDLGGAGGAVDTPVEPGPTGHRRRLAD